MLFQVFFFLDKRKISHFSWPKLQIVHCSINNNLEVIGVSQNNNLVSTIKFHQNTYRIPLLCVNTIKIMTRVSLKKKKGKLPFTLINYNALTFSSYELPTMLLCQHELPFCAQKPLMLAKAVNSNGQPVTLHHFALMNYNALSLCLHELQRIVTLPS